MAISILPRRASRQAIPVSCWPAWPRCCSFLPGLWRCFRRVRRWACYPGLSVSAGLFSVLQRPSRPKQEASVLTTPCRRRRFIQIWCGLRSVAPRVNVWVLSMELRGPARGLAGASGYVLIRLGDNKRTGHAICGALQARGRVRDRSAERHDRQGSESAYLPGNVFASHAHGDPLTSVHKVRRVWLDFDPQKHLFCCRQELH